jgi:catechol 2,3-dioxygenase-like lactoylglutathione lyase family enzyme
MITGMPRIAVAVRDLDRAVATFRDGFGLPVNEVPNAAGSLGVRIAMCAPHGGSNVELMSPADPSKPLNASLQRFLDRRGEALFALMLEAPDPNAEAEDLSARGLDVLPLMPGAGGRDVHPRSTHGVLIRVYPTRPHNQLPDGPRAIGLSGISRVQIAVRDFDDAVAVYRDRFGMRLEVCPPDAARGVQAAICSPGTGGVIEIVSPRDEQRPFAATLTRFLAERGEGLFAVVLAAADLDAAVAALGARGFALHEWVEGPETRAIDPSSAFGAQFVLERGPA